VKFAIAELKPETVSKTRAKDRTARQMQVIDWEDIVEIVEVKSR